LIYYTDGYQLYNLSEKIQKLEILNHTRLYIKLVALDNDGNLVVVSTTGPGLGLGQT